MDTTGTEYGERRDAATVDLLRSLVADSKALVLCEARIAAREFKEKTSEARSGAAMLGAGLLIAAGAFLTFTAAAVLALALALPAWAAATIVGLALSCVATVLMLVARARFRGALPLAPTEAIEAAKEDAEWIRTRAEELRTIG